MDERDVGRWGGCLLRALWRCFWASRVQTIVRPFPVSQTLLNEILTNRIYANL